MIAVSNNLSTANVCCQPKLQTFQFFFQYSGFKMATYYSKNIKHKICCNYSLNVKPIDCSETGALRVQLEKAKQANEPLKKVKKFNVYFSSTTHC